MNRIDPSTCAAVPMQCTYVHRIIPFGMPISAYQSNNFAYKCLQACACIASGVCSATACYTDESCRSRCRVPSCQCSAVHMCAPRSCSVCQTAYQSTNYACKLALASPSVFVQLQHATRVNRVDPTTCGVPRCKCSSHVCTAFLFGIPISAYQSISFACKVAYIASGAKYWDTH